MDFIEIKHTYRTHKDATSFSKWECYPNKLARQAAIFETGFSAITKDFPDGFLPLSSFCSGSTLA